jgi:hypothetical protein
LKAGIHVLILGVPSRRPPAGGPLSVWRGWLLRAPKAGAAALLEREKERLLEFKERYLRLASEARFYGASKAHRPALSFPSARPSDVAAGLERVEPAARVGASLGYALLAFYIPVLAAAAFRRLKLALILAGPLLAGFIAYSALSPPSVRSLRVEFFLPEASEPAEMRLRELPSAAGARAYRQEGEPIGPHPLVYRSFVAPGGELPIQIFTRERTVRFNQIPEVRQERGSLLLRFRNPLAAWSLE